MNGNELIRRVERLTDEAEQAMSKVTPDECSVILPLTKCHKATHEIHRSFAEYFGNGLTTSIEEVVRKSIADEVSKLKINHGIIIRLPSWMGGGAVEGIKMRDVGVLVLLLMVAWGMFTAIGVLPTRISRAARVMTEIYSGIEATNVQNP